MDHEKNILSESESGSYEETLDTVESVKETKKITPAQCGELLSFMNGRVGFKKGKMKHTDETSKFIAEWNELTLKLNTMGPPIHSSVEWRRVLTRLKSKRKRKLSPASLLQSQNDNKRTKDPGCTSSFSDSNPTSSVSHIIKDDVSTECNMELPLLVSISKAIDSFVKEQAKVNEDLNKKIDCVIEQQAAADSKNEKLIRLCEILANIFGEDINV